MGLTLRCGRWAGGAETSPPELIRRPMLRGVQLGTRWGLYRRAQNQRPSALALAFVRPGCWHGCSVGGRRLLARARDDRGDVAGMRARRERYVRSSATGTTRFCADK